MESIISFVDLYVYYSMRANIFTQFFHIIFTNCISSFAGCYPAARQAPARKKGCLRRQPFIIITFLRKAQPVSIRN